MVVQRGIVLVCALFFKPPQVTPERRAAVTRVQPIPTWQRSLIILASTVVGFLVIVGLQWGRPVLIPICLAVLLTILLSPVVASLESRGLGRVLSVIVTVSTASLILMCLGWMVARQMAGILAELPQNTAVPLKVSGIGQIACPDSATTPRQGRQPQPRPT